MLVKKMDDPTHTAVGPSTIPALGTGFTVTLKVDVLVPHAEVTV